VIAGHGRVAIYAEVRCSFQGIELQPGAEIEMRLPPGTYALRVWNPGAVGHWEQQTVHVRSGGTLHQTCAPELGR
jgi:hypothetical protein